MSDTDQLGAAEKANLLQIRALIANDGYAASFQSFGQYRSALLKAIDAANGHALCVTSKPTAKTHPKISNS